MANNLRYDFNMILHKKQVFRYILKLKQPPVIYLLHYLRKIKISVIM